MSVGFVSILTVVVDVYGNKKLNDLKTVAYRNMIDLEKVQSGYGVALPTIAAQTSTFSDNGALHTLSG